MYKRQGLDIIIIKPAYTFSKIRKHYQTVGIGYLCIPKNDHVQLSDEHTDYLFATIDKAKELLDEEIFNDIIYTINEYYDKMSKKDVYKRQLQYYYYNNEVNP